MGSGKFSSLDVIMLIHNATLELYGVPKSDKSLGLVTLLSEVADGQRTFVESDSDPALARLRAEAEASGFNLQSLARDMRAGERNAARSLQGLPPIEG